MTVAIQGLDEIVDLARAIGLVDAGGNLDADWFRNPGERVSGALRVEAQRDALLRALGRMLGGGEVQEEGGRSWVPVVSEGGIALHVVLEETPGGVVVSLGARLTTTAPTSRTDIVVPLLLVPESADAAPVPGTDNGRVRLESDLAIGAPPGPGEAGLAGLAFSVDVRADGQDPQLSVLLRGLQLPGQTTPRDLRLGSGPGADLADDALRLVLGVLRESVADAAGPLAEMLSLVGISGDAAIPPLPIADLLERGVPAWRDWLEGVLADDAAVSAWLAHLTALVGRGAALRPPAAPGLPSRVAWTLPGGAEVAITVRTTADAAGARLVEIGASARATGTGAVPAGVEADAVLLRIVLGPAPAAVALPRLDLLARLGPDGPTGPPLVDVTNPRVVRVRALRSGLALGPQGRAVLVLAAHDVTIAAHHYDVLDLTNAQTLADVGGAAVGDVAAEVLGLLGPAGVGVRVLLGLSPPSPAGDPWPVAATTLPDLLADPLGAVLRYHARVLGEHRDGYLRLLASLQGLLAAPGAPAPAGSGTEEEPWRIPLAAGIALTAWADGDPAVLHVGLSVDHAVTDLGGSCPTVALTLAAELARVPLADPGTGQALTDVQARLVFGARGGIPLRVGTDEIALVADHVGLRLRWGTGAALSAGLVAPNLGAEIDGEIAPLVLPTVQADGTLSADVPWRALELLTGELLSRLGPSWAQDLVGLLGWIGASEGPAEPPVALALEALAADPVHALRDWLWHAAESHLAQWLSALLTGPFAAGLGAGVVVGGGHTEDPFVLPLVPDGLDAARGAHLLVRTRSAPEQVVVSPFLPGRLAGWLDALPGTTTAPTAEEMAGALRVAGLESLAVRELLEGRRDLAAGLAQLSARWLDSDGLVRAADAVLPGATVHELPGVAHFDLPAALDLEAVLGVAAPAARIFVTGPLGVPDWPGVAADNELDLTTPGLPAEAFDVSRAGAVDGPWLVRLGHRADAVTAPGQDGTAGQAARLARVVDAVVARAGGAPVALVAHGGAGHAAAVAAARPGVTHLVTLGTPHTGLDLSVLEQQPAAGALQLLASLVPPADDVRLEHPKETLGRALLAPLIAAYQAPVAPGSDLAPPTVAAPAPPGVEVHCVRGRVGDQDVSKGLCGLVLRGLQDAYEQIAPAALTPEPPRELAIGAGIHVGTPAAAGAVSVRASMSVLLPVPGFGSIGGVRVRIAVERPGGWLAGGPDPSRPAGVGRHPSLRRATIELDVPLGGGAAAARVILHEAEALGVRRARWVVSHTDLADGSPLLPEARVVIGRLGAALGPLPADGAVRGVVDLLAALGVAHPAATGAAVDLSLDGVRRLVVDPEGLLRDAPAPELAAALAALLGGAVPAPGQVAVDLDGLRATADVAARTVRLETSAAGCALAAGGSVRARVDVAAAGITGAQATLTAGPIVLEADGPPARVTLRCTEPGLPAEVQLLPVADGAGLARIVAAAVPAQVLWAGIEYVRALDPVVPPLLDPVLDAFGLLRDGRVRPPVGLLADPAGWLARADVLGPAATPERVAGLLDAAGALLGLPRPLPGTVGLPLGIELSASPLAGGTRLALGLPALAAGADLRAAATVALGLGGARAVPQAELLLGTPGPGALQTSGRLAIALGAEGVRVRLVVPSAGADLLLLPAEGGLSGLAGAAGAAALRALPEALDALAAIAPTSPARPVGVAVAELGDALGLRTGGRFSAQEIDALAANPGPELAVRLSDDLARALDALRALVVPALPAAIVLSRDGEALALTVAGTPRLELRLAVPGGGAPLDGVRVTGSVTGVRPFAGATLGAALAIDGDGLAEARATFGVDAAAAIALGPLRLAPRAEVVAGHAATGGARIAAGLAVDADTSVSGVLRTGPPRTFALEAEGAGLPEALAELLLPLAVDLVLATDELEALLERQVLAGATLRELLAGVLFEEPGGGFDAGVLDPANAFGRLLRLARNVAGHAPALNLDPLRVGIEKRAGQDIYGLRVTLGPGERFDLGLGGEVTLAAEVDDSWVEGPAGAAGGGVTIELLEISGGAPRPFFALAVRGVGLRLGKASGPLLDTGLTVDSVALHGLLEASADDGVRSAGGQLELTRMRVPVGSATGGSNRVASGILRDSASGTERLEPALSPALAIQRHGTDPVSVALRAGEGDGPWWLPIQRGFGPVYVEQIGFGVTRPARVVTAARVMVDGRVSLLGLNVAVDDLALGARWPQTPADPPVFSPQAWEVGLAGLAVSADLAGLQLSGGLSKAPGASPDYVGMLGLGFGPYRLTVLGAYGVMTDAQGEFTSLFLFGALNAPLGGPPAFFVTGIGAGVGINRRLLLPPSLADLPAYPLVRALDANAPEAANPAAGLEALRAYYPAQRGAFWFAAGISFTSFALVDCVAVLGVAVADGLEVNLMGVARAALPTTYAPIVQLELALLARFSSREGTLLVQGQLTDNSYLLTRDCRLTGGFAYQSWFKGPNAGEFVLTLGGYHPSFRREDYPVVPRLGYVWGVSDILVIKGESYFALTSEAVMAGTRFEASLNAGPLWAYLRLGVDVIVWFDPFKFVADAFAALGAGITIDIDLGWFGHVRITISISLEATVHLEGPEFRGSATIDLDVTSVRIAFGADADRSTPALDWNAFEQKYLRADGSNVLAASGGLGLLAPAPGSGRKPATGRAGDPFLVLPEFSLNVVTTAAAEDVLAGSPVATPGGEPLSIGPMRVAAISSRLVVDVLDAQGQTSDEDGVYVSRLEPAATMGAFPKGAWAPLSDDVPKGETLRAANGVTLTGRPTIAPGTVEIDSREVDTGRRHPLPFLGERTVRADRLPDVQAAQQLVAGLAGDVDAVLQTAQHWLASGALGGTPSPVAAATFRGARSAPPQLVPLTLGMAVAPGENPTVAGRKPKEEHSSVDRSPHPPFARALLTAAPDRHVRATPRTTVGEAGASTPRVPARKLARTRESHDPRLPAKLVLRSLDGAVTGETVVAPGGPPFTGRAGAGAELRRTPAAPHAARSRLDAIGDAVRGEGTELLAGELAVLELPNAGRDTLERRPALQVEGDAPVRLVVLDTAGGALRDVALRQGTVLLPPRSARIAVLAGGAPQDGAPGWHAGTTLVQAGFDALVGPGCTLTSSALATTRGIVRVSSAALVEAADAVMGFGVVTTRLPADVRAVAIVLEQADTAGPDDVDLGLTGARRAVGDDGLERAPVLVVGGGRRIEVHDVEPDGKARAVSVTVASAEAVHLSGVLGAREDAAAFAERLQATGLQGVGGTLFPVPAGRARVRWLAPEDAPEQDEVKEL